MALGHPFRTLLITSLATAGCLFAPSCTAVDSQEGGRAPVCVGVACSTSDGGTKDQVVADVPPPDAGQETGPPGINPLCGTGCLPDDLEACSGYASGGGVLDAGSEATPMSDVDAGFGPDAPGAPAPLAGCYVANKGGEPVPECQLAGSGEVGAPCVSSSGCAAGLACVGVGTAAQCRPYCCGDPAGCATGTYCAERPLKEDGLDPLTKPLAVPVCVPADGCKLDEPYPCPSGASCTCKEGLACMLVKDKTTACVVPGAGRNGEACPCAAGYVCSKATNTCLKICSTQAAQPECGSGKCLAVPTLPEGFGVCGLGNMDAG
jgi:hypothetical protein